MYGIFLLNSHHETSYLMLEYLVVPIYKSLSSHLMPTVPGFEVSHKIPQAPHFVPRIVVSGGEGVALVGHAVPHQEVPDAIEFVLVMLPLDVVLDACRETGILPTLVELHQLEKLHSLVAQKVERSASLC